MRIAASVLSAVAAVLVILVSGPLRAADADLDKLYQAAKSEPALNWYQVPLAQEVGEKVAAAFVKKYPGLQVTAQRAPAQTFFQKIAQEIQAGVPGADVFTSSVTNHMTELKGKSQLLPYIPKSAATMLDVPGVKGMDSEGYYQGTIVYPVTIVYNTQKLKADEAPKTLKEFTDKKWSGKIALANPGTSGTWGIMVVAMTKIYGMDIIKQLADNKATVLRSLPDVINSVQSGEHSVGIGPASIALAAKAQGQPIDVIYQTDGVMPAISPTAILKKTKSPNAAKLFVEFLHSAEMSQIVAGDFNESLHASVSPPAGAKSMAEVTVILPTDSEVEAQLPKVTNAWKDAFGL